VFGAVTVQGNFRNIYNRRIPHYSLSRRSVRLAWCSYI